MALAEQSDNGLNEVAWGPQGTWLGPSSRPNSAAALGCNVHSAVPTTVKGGNIDQFPPAVVHWQIEYKAGK